MAAIAEAANKTYADTTNGSHSNGSLPQAAPPGSVLPHLVLSSSKTGGLVTFPEDYAHVPVLTGSDGNPVLLYRVVEEIEHLVDPAELQAQFPTLSYTQIVAALMFLRKVAQFNTRNLDLDEVEDAELESSEAFQEIVAQSLKSEELRIVYPPK